MAQEVLVGLDHLEYPVKHEKSKRGLSLHHSLVSQLIHIYTHMHIYIHTHFKIESFFFFLLSFRFPSTMNSKGSHQFFICRSSSATVKFISCSSCLFR